MYDYVTDLYFLISFHITRLTLTRLRQVSPTPLFWIALSPQGTKTSFPTDRRIHAGTSASGIASSTLAITRSYRN